MSLGDGTVQFILRGTQTPFQVRAVLGYQILRFLQLLLLIVTACLELFQTLAFRRALLTGSGLCRRLRLGLLRGLLRGGHVIQLRCNGAQLSLHLVNRGIGHGLLGRQMADQNLLTVAVTKSYPGHNNERNDSHQQPPTGTPSRESRLFAAFIFFEMFRHSFSPRSRNSSGSTSAEESPQSSRTAKILCVFKFLRTDATAPFGYVQSKHRPPRNEVVVKSSVVKKQEEGHGVLLRVAGTSPGIFSLSPERLSLNPGSLTWMNSLAIALLHSFRCASIRVVRRPDQGSFVETFAPAPRGPRCSGHVLLPQFQLARRRPAPEIIRPD